MRRATAVVVALALVAGGCSLHPNDNTLPGQVALGSDGYTVTGVFDKVDNLVPNSTVQHDDVVIGTVTKITVVDFQAHVTMRLRKSERLPANVRFTIGQKTLLGAQFVDVVDPPDPSGSLRAGAVLRQDLTGTYPETEKILAGVSLLLNNGGLSQINDITTELNTTLDQRVPDTRDLITRLNRLLRTLDARKDDIVRALESLNRLTRTIARQRATVARAIDDIGPGLAALERQRALLVDATTTLGRFSATTNQLVNASQESLLANLGALRPIVKELERSGKALPESLDFLVTIPFPVSTTPKALKGDYGNLFLTLDASVPSLLSAFVGTGAAADTSAAMSDPLADPLGADDRTRRSITDLLGGSAQEKPRAGTGASPTPRPSSSATPQAEPSCTVVTALLGGCR
ncbi:MAG: MCE family protein [Aeromicrobium erythreum]